MTKRSSGLRIPSNAVPLLLLNVFLHILHLYLPLLESWITIFPCPTFPLDGHASFRQYSWEASIFCVPLAFLFFIDAIWHNGCPFYHAPRTFRHHLAGLYRECKISLSFKKRSCSSCLFFPVMPIIATRVKRPQVLAKRSLPKCSSGKYGIACISINTAMATPIQLPEYFRLSNKSLGFFAQKIIGEDVSYSFMSSPRKCYSWSSAIPSC